MEVGPLARVLVNYGLGRAATVRAVDAFLARVNGLLPVASALGVADLHSIVGRFSARAIETKLLADRMATWVGQLRAILPAGGNASAKVTFAMPTAGTGAALNEARAARSATGSRSRARRSRTTRWSCRRPGTSARATRPAWRARRSAR